jgi:photosystem II stability/assembly factor-like uncharacterized protein
MKHLLSLLAILLSLTASTTMQSLRAQSTQDKTSIPPTSQGQQGWEQVHGGTKGPIRFISFTSKDTAYACGDSTVLRSIDGGSSWQYLPSPDAFHGSFSDTKNGYVVGDTRTPYRTVDGGMTWTPCANDSIPFPSQLLAISSDSAFVIGSGYGVSRTTNGGKIWTFISEADISQMHTGFDGEAIDFYDSKHGVIVGFNQGGPAPRQSGAGCFTTSDGGATWIQQYTGSQDDLFGMAYFDRDTLIAVGGKGYISRSTDGGIHWDSVIVAMPTQDRLLAVDARSNRIIGVGGGIGPIYTSTDAGLTWKTEKSGVTVDLYTIKMFDATTALAGGEQGTIIKTTNGGVDWVQVFPPSNQQLLTRTYPEPSKSTVQILYTLPQMQHVTLTILDVTGKLIGTPLTHQLQTLGSHTLPFDGSRYPAGVYTYRVQTERYYATGKFTLVK